MRLDHYHHHCDEPEPQWAKEIRAQLNRIETLMADETASIASLTAKVTANGDAEQSAITLLGNLKTALDAAIASSGSDNNAALQALSDTLGSQDDALAAAVVANTPAA